MIPTWLHGIILHRNIKAFPQPLNKALSGIHGFDQLSYGGLPRNRTTLLKGGPGSGKTLFALQTLVNAAHQRQESGIFVAFEESPRHLIENAASFDWNLPALGKDKLYFHDAQLSPEVIQSGDFDLSGLLAMMKAKKEEMNAHWIVFDGMDVLLTLLQNPVAEMREIYRIRDWLAANDLSAIVTAKADASTSEVIKYGFLEFMVDCAVGLNRRIEYGVALHRIEITKYRGSDFVAGEFPVSFGLSGMEVGAPEPTEITQDASGERCSAGFERLDTMLGGGLFRGSSTLITGVPGTSKTTLAGKFAEAACMRGERTLFVSFDESANRIVSNLTSVGIQLGTHIESGLLRIYSGRTESIGPEDQLINLKALIDEHQPQCMVIDPLSAIAKSGGLVAARAVANRFIYLAKDKKITVMVTAVNEGDNLEGEATDLQISMVADTWIHLSYMIHNGERNRALTIIKSRGTSHSNQVRELILSSDGLILADVYTAGGEVLMGTMRWEKEGAEKAKALQKLAEFNSKRNELQVAEEETRASIKALQQNLKRQSAELETYFAENEALVVSASERRKELRRIRGADFKEHELNEGKAAEPDTRQTANGAPQNRTAGK